MIKITKEIRIIRIRITEYPSQLSKNIHVQNKSELAEMPGSRICIFTPHYFTVPAALVGMVYIYGREKYFTGYVREAKGR